MKTDFSKRNLLKDARLRGSFKQDGINCGTGFQKISEKLYKGADEGLIVEDDGENEDQFRDDDASQDDEKDDDKRDGDENDYDSSGKIGDGLNQGLHLCFSDHMVMWI